MRSPSLRHYGDGLGSDVAECELLGNFCMGVEAGRFRDDTRCR